MSENRFIQMSATLEARPKNELPMTRSFSAPGDGQFVRAMEWKISSSGVELIKKFEHFMPNKYNDQAGHCTVGYGTLIHHGNCNGDASEASYANGITEEKATELLMERVNSTEKVINDTVTVTLNQNQFDALISFVYNIGTGAWKGSTCRRLLNQGQYESVPTEMKKWIKVRGKGGVKVDSKGLINRRAQESALFTKTATSSGQSLAFGYNGHDELSNVFSVQSDFIDKYAQNAVDSMKTTQVPASVTLAQAALESGWGKHAPGFNFFGIKAGSSWTGKKQLLTTHEIHSDNDKNKHNYPEVISITEFTDSKGATKYKWKVKDNFRAYDSATDSFNDHGNFLVANKRYKKAFDYTNDSHQFIQEVAKAGYATDPNYASVLISIVDKNNLTQYDKATTTSTGQSFVYGQSVTVQEAASDILSNPGRVIIPANIKKQLEQIRDNGTYTLGANTFVPSLSILQSINQMMYYSLDHNKTAPTAFSMLSYMRPKSTHHSNGTAIDLSHIDGIRIDVRNQAQCLSAVVTAINNLVPGSYALGLPRPPYADGAGAQHDFDTYNKHITVYENSNPPTLLPQYQNLPTTDNLFLPNKYNEHSPSGRTATDLNFITNANSRATLKTAIDNASARGANILFLFADALDHLHIQAMS